MIRTPLAIPEIAIIAGTRAALGAGIGLLLADRLNAALHRSSASVEQRPEPTKGEPPEAAGKKLYGNFEDDLATLLGRAAGSRGGAYLSINCATCIFLYDYAEFPIFPKP